MRLIDADKIVYSWQVDADGQEHDGVTLQSIIDKMPTIEPEQKKGKWNGYNADNPDWQRDDGSPVFLVCSECGATVVNNFAATWNYCCVCGADMRGEQG